jgi:hypothetical protein
MEQKENTCCVDKKDNSKKGLLAGILYGLIPHSFCLAFILFSVVGATVATAFLKKFLLIPYLFPMLVILSIILATTSSLIYLKRTNCLCAQGLKDKWKYITILYSSTILVNLLIFFLIIPMVVNINPVKATIQGEQSAKMSLNVNIPCSGHASLIIDELKKDSAVQSVKFALPSNFEINYDPQKTSPEKIAQIEIFKTYPATVIN